MSQLTTGVHSVLAAPWCYDTLQLTMGARSLRNQLVREFVQPESDSAILDIGCGTAAILAHLPKTVRYYGFDLSARYIAYAKRTFADRGVFQARDLAASQIDELPPIDIAIAFSLLHHLNDSEVAGLFAMIKRFMKPGGRLISVDPCLSPKQNAIARFLIRRDRGQNVRDLKSYARLARGAFPRVHAIEQHRAWVPYTHCIMCCTVAEAS